MKQAVEVSSKVQGSGTAQGPQKTRFGAPPAENADYLERKFQRFGQPVSGTSVPKTRQQTHTEGTSSDKRQEPTKTNSRLPPQNVRPMATNKDPKLPPKQSLSGHKGSQTTVQPSHKGPQLEAVDQKHQMASLVQDFGSEEAPAESFRDIDHSDRESRQDTVVVERGAKTRKKESSGKQPKPLVSGVSGGSAAVGQSGKVGTKVSAKDDLASVNGGNQGSSITQAHQAFDYHEIHKLLDRMKRLSDSNARLSAELAQLQQRIDLHEKINPQEDSQKDPDGGSPSHWSHLRDKVFKAELLQLRLEAHRLRSSSRLNDRFGDLLALHSRESESLVSKCLSLVDEEDSSATSSRKSNALLLEVVSCLIKHNSTVQGAKRDFDILQAELGAGNRREWDGDFGHSEIHSATKLVTSVEQVLLDHEGNLSDIISRIESSRLESTEEVSLLKECLLSQVNALVKKSFLIGSFIFDKKSVQELSKKLKPLQDASLRSALIVLEERLREQIENLKNCTDSQIQQLVAHQAKSIADKAYSDQSLGSLNKVGAMMTFIEYQLKMARSEAALSQIVHRNEYFAREAAHSLYGPTTQLLNFLDRNVYNMQSEVYVQLRNTILQNWDKYLAGETLRPQHAMYLHSLINDTKQLLFKNQFGQDEPPSRQSRPPVPRRHAPVEEWPDNDSQPTHPSESPRNSDISQKP